MAQPSPSPLVPPVATLNAETALRFAAEARTMLAAHPEPEAMLQALGRLALPALGDICVVDIEDPRAGRRRVVASVLPPGDEARIREYVATYPPALSFDMPELQAGTPLFLTPAEANAAQPAADPARVAAARALGIISGLVVPMHARGSLVGVMKFATTAHSGRRLSEADAALAAELASQAAYALDHVRLVSALRVELDERRHAEAVLCEREAQLRGFFEAPGLQMLIVELAGTTEGRSPDVMVLRANTATAAMFGQSPASIARQSFRTLGTLPAVVEHLHARLLHCRETGDALSFEIEAGLGVNVPPVRASVRRIGDDPACSPLAVVLTDISEERQLEAQFSGFFNADGVLMAVVEVDDERQDIVIRAANQTFAAFHGHVRDGVVGRSGREIGISEEKSAQLYALYRTCRETGQPMLFEIETDAPSGHWMLGSLRRIGTDSGHAYIASVFTDITDLRQSQARLEGFFETPGAAMAILTLDDEAGDVRVTRANAAHAALWGLTPAQVAGRSLHDLTGDETLAAEYYVLVDQCRRTGAPVTREQRWQAPGGERVLFVTLSRIGSGSTPASVASIVLDVTTERRLNAELLQAQKMEVVGQVAGGIAHDFNNVLTVIGAATEALLGGGGTETQRRKDLLEVRRAVGHATELTRQLLGFSRRQHTERQLLNVNDVVHEITPMLRRLLRADIDVRLDLANGLPLVLADRGQVGQVLMNLVLNARDAMPEGGRLTIATRCLPASAVPPGEGAVLSASGGGSAMPTPGATYYSALVVMDTGVGMSEEVRARVFEPLFSTKAPERGTGLGLSTVRTIIEAAGGQVWVESTLGEGATFGVALPSHLALHQAATDMQGASADAPRGDALPVVAPPATSGEETLLLVVKDAAIRLFVARALRAKGYQLLLAASREEALAVVQAQGGQVDLLVTDLELADATGPALAVALGEMLDVPTRSLPVVYISGYASGQDPGDRSGRRDWAELAAPVVAKPFTSEELGHAIRIARTAAAGRGRDPDAAVDARAD